MYFSTYEDDAPDAYGLGATPAERQAARRAAAQEARRAARRRAARQAAARTARQTAARNERAKLVREATAALNRAQRQVTRGALTAAKRAEFMRTLTVPDQAQRNANWRAFGYWLIQNTRPNVTATGRPTARPRPQLRVTAGPRATTGRLGPARAALPRGANPRATGGGGGGGGGAVSVGDDREGPTATSATPTAATSSGGNAAIPILGGLALLSLLL